MKSKLSETLSKIMTFIVNLLLPMFYLFCIICLIGGGLYYYNKQLDQKKMILKIERRITLKEIGDVAIIPLKDNVDSSKLTYTVKDENIAIVNDDGKIVAKGEGITVMTVKSDDNKQQSIVVSVGQKAIDKTNDNDYVDNIIAEAEKNTK